jgi:hypothetical protein
MTPELTEKLLSKYPEQFKNLKGIECDDGWYDLLDKLFYVVKNRMDYAQRLNQPLDFGWQQIKEKFGGLRAYCYGSDDLINGAITMAESVSYMTCEVTGEKGKIRRKKIIEGEVVPAWMKTLCDIEAEKQGYVL